MVRRLIIGLFLSLALAVRALAQSTAPAGDAQAESSGPVFPYALMVIFTILILVIVCMPSRKS